MTQQINETFFALPIIEDIQKAKLPPKVLCRVSYPVCVVGVKNANGRIYEDAVWDKVFENKDLQQKLKDRALFGHAEHPEQTQSNLEKTSHVIFEMWKGDGKIWQKIDVLDTPTGQIVNTLLMAGCKVGMSTRAEGDLEEGEDDKGNKYSRVIPESYRYVTTDFTADPSTEGALPHDIRKNVVSEVKKVLQSEKLNESEKEFASLILEGMECGDGKCVIDSAKKLAEKAKDQEKFTVQKLIDEQKITVGTKVKYGDQKAEVKEIKEGTISLLVSPQGEGQNPPSLSVSVQGDVSTSISPDGIITILSAEAISNIAQKEPKEEELEIVEPEDMKSDEVKATLTADQSGEKPEAYKEPGEQDRVGPVEGSYQRAKYGNVGKRKQAGETCPEESEEVKEDKIPATAGATETLQIGNTLKDKKGNYWRIKNLTVLGVTLEPSSEGVGTVKFVKWGDVESLGLEKVAENVDIDETKAINKLYTDAGLTPPEGKGIHTKAFHQCAVGYAKKIKSGEMTMQEAYKRCMGALGSEKAVKKEHQQKKESRTNEKENGLVVNFDNIEDLEDWVKKGGWKDVSEFFEGTGTTWDEIKGKSFQVVGGRLFVEESKISEATFGTARAVIDMYREKAEKDLDFDSVVNYISQMSEADYDALKKAIQEGDEDSVVQIMSGLVESKITNEAKLKEVLGIKTDSAHFIRESVENVGYVTVGIALGHPCIFVQFSRDRETLQGIVVSTEEEALDKGRKIASILGVEFRSPTKTESRKLSEISKLMSKVQSELVDLRKVLGEGYLQDLEERKAPSSQLESRLKVNEKLGPNTQKFVDLLKKEGYEVDLDKITELIDKISDDMKEWDKFVAILDSENMEDLSNFIKGYEFELTKANESKRVNKKKIEEQVERIPKSDLPGEEIDDIERSGKKLDKELYPTLEPTVMGVLEDGVGYFKLDDGVIFKIGEVDDDYWVFAENPFIIDKVIKLLELEKQWAQEPAEKDVLADDNKLEDLLGGNESISTTSKEIKTLRIQEASIRAERDKAIELLEEATNDKSQSKSKVLETKILISKIKEMSARSDLELKAICSKLEEKAKLILEMKSTIKTKDEQGTALGEELDKIKEASVATAQTLQESIKTKDENHKNVVSELNEKHDKFVSEIKEEYEKTLSEEIEEARKEAEEKVTKEFVKCFIDLRLSESGLKIDENSQALLENCKSIEDVDDTLDGILDVRRRNALHSESIQSIQINKAVPRDPAQVEADRKVSDALEGMGFVNNRKGVRK